MRFLFLVTLFSCSALDLHASFYNLKAEGWHWYEHKTPDTKPQRRMKKVKDSSVHLLKAFQERLENLKATAVINPTFENVKSYMEIQRVLLERASKFSETWLQVLFTTPHLDYSLKHPTSQVGRHVYLEEEQKKLELQIHALSKTHGLFFIFKGTCPYAQKFAPIVKVFSKKYGWSVIAISVDGLPLPEFKNPRKKYGILKALQIKHTPTLLAIEPKTNKIYPLNIGTQDQIEERIRLLILKESL
ncbi:MAG: type-F conjugative transfer system pilin assembly protein TraF [Alphaproteobacteria bacterium]|jgi:conjugal transfer pilus assembly protein TraF|nr:type-F conjugative transfer system pilin assembly protein TraF [Alphaproteobacteria bacterium]MBT5389485.1 type-F conjugative transfer system pilin assembly protein TraF [Alphaproteobacteria bacterium]MBT5540366.1 type-F conjugative transfer system pilin assembly protein TraF [Alphaproteobacteria bacterium]MBT5654595.1 type-F conjugative transfer system pilin assembly protein TraF [Alphaproteobacteria bacterium]